MKILCLTRYGRLGASSRLRLMQYFPYLSSQGVDVTVNTLLDDSYLTALYDGQSKQFWKIFLAYIRRISVLLRSQYYDLIWIEKELFPWLPAWAGQLLGRLKVPYIVDYDDAIFHNYDLARYKWIRQCLGSKIDRVMGSSSLVTVGNIYLAERAQEAGAKQVEIIPTVVDIERYFTDSLSSRSTFTIGWIGTPKTAKYLSIIKTALQEVCANEQARLKLVGAGSMKISGIITENCEWREESETSYIQSFDVGIMPLLDGPWERGKCGYKLIQYMACAKPVVASPVGKNKEIVIHGKTGYLASNHNEWVNALKSLINDTEMCKEMGRLARKRVESEYSLQVTAPKLLTLFQKVISETKR